MTTAILGAFMAHSRPADESAACSERGRVVNSLSGAVYFCQPRPCVQSLDNAGVKSPYRPLGQAFVFLAVEDDLDDQSRGLVRHLDGSVDPAVPFACDDRLSLPVAPADPEPGLGLGFGTGDVINESDDRLSFLPDLLTLEQQKRGARIELAPIEHFLVVGKAKIVIGARLRPDL